MGHDNDNELPRTRAEAKKVGAKRYFTGEPCKNGHIDLRVTKDGRCMECSREKTRQIIKRDPGKKRERDRQYRIRNKEKLAAKRLEKKEERAAGQKAWRDRNPDYSQKWKKANPDKVRSYSKKMYERSWQDPKFRIEASIRAGVNKGIRKGSKSARRTFEVLGYSLSELMRHLEKQFEPGMSWDNHGIHGWHIDHRIPLDAHNYETPDDVDFKKAWALQNLRPMWGVENISKHAKLDKPFQPSLALADNDNTKIADKAI